MTTLSLIFLAGLSVAGSVLGLVWLVGRKAGDALRKWQYSLIGTCTLGCWVLWGYRIWFVHEGWQPLNAHVDGLLLIGCLFSLVILYLQRRGGFGGLVAFGLPVLSVVLIWSICASAWTFHPFKVDTLWMAVHLGAVYLGALFFAVAGIGGGMFLYAQRKLRERVAVGTAVRQMASLEAIERLIVRCSTLGFVLLTVGLITGLIQMSTEPRWLDHDWRYWSKLGLAGAVWLIYAVVMNVKRGSSFRGATAAWLSMAGLVLLLVTFGVAVGPGGAG